VRRAISGTLYLTLGALAGVASALAAFDSIGSYQAEKGSPWHVWDVSTSDAAHPYALAHFLTAGRLPPETGQMREFVAQRSSDGSVLDAACRYVLTAAGPSLPHWWSLLATSGRGLRQDTAFLASDTAVAESDGRMRVTVSREPASGNWIEAPARGAFSLIFTAADPSTVSGRRTPPSFTISQVGC
jgi:hypothetical protein